MPLPDRRSDLRIALPVLVNPQGSPLDAFFPAEAHDYLGHVTFTGTIGELVQFMQVMQDQGRLSPEQEPCRFPAGQRAV